MNKKLARAELTKIAKEMKTLGKTTRDIPTKRLVAIAEKSHLNTREIIELLDEVWASV